LSAGGRDLFTLLLAAPLLALALLPGRATAEPRTVGWLEAVVFPDIGLRVVAKLDTGAKTSCLDAESIEFSEKKGEKWARFSLRRRRGSLDARAFEARVAGERKVRTSNGHETRPVVDLWVCVGGERRRVLFTLTRRAEMNYRVILGRRALEGRLLVDSARKFTTEPGCEAR